MEEKAIVELVEQTVTRVVTPELERWRARADEREHTVEERMTELNERFNNFAHRVFTFLEEQDRKLAGATGAINDKFDKVFSTLDFVLKRVETVQTEYLAISETLKRIEGQMLTWNGRAGSLDALQQKLQDVAARAQQLEARVRQLETPPPG